MALYDPQQNLQPNSPPQNNYKDTINVEFPANEKGEVESNTVRGATRTIVIKVVSAPGTSAGTQTFIQDFVRQQGEDYVTVEVKKQGQKEGEGTVEYD